MSENRERNRLLVAAAAAIAVTGAVAVGALTGGLEPAPAPSPAPSASSVESPAPPLEGDGLPLVGGKRPEVVYELSVSRDAEGREETRTVGALTASEWQRAARPWTHADGEATYHDQHFSRPDGRGGTVTGYRVFRTADGVRAPAPPRVRETRVAPSLLKRARTSASVDVRVSLRDFPRWDVPLPLPVGPFTDGEREQGRLERERAIAARRELFERRSSDLVASLRRMGAQVRGLEWSSGAVSAHVASAAVRALSERDDVSAIDDAGGDARAVQTQDWFLGEGKNGSRTDLDQWAGPAGAYKGDFPNPSRHSYGRIAEGIFEVGPFKDEVCYLGDGSGCSSPTRVLAKYDCQGATPGDRCQPVASYNGTDSPPSVFCCNVDADCAAAFPTLPGLTCVSVPATLGCGGTGNKACNCVDTATDFFCTMHATAIASIAVGDYSDGQADDVNVGDDACGTSPCVHGATFKNRASGVAQEAAAMLIGDWVATTTNDQIDAAYSGYRVAEQANLDVLNASWVFRGPPFVDCTLDANTAVQSEAENVFDDGVFLVQGTGNNAAAGCNISPPSTMPKVFAVGGVNIGVAGACTTNYNACAVTPAASSNGGITATTPDLVPHVGVVSAVALIAPTSSEYWTFASQTYGLVTDTITFGNLRFGGSSGAAAFASGAATVTKHRYLASLPGAPWINAPGRMFAVMLLQADRYQTGLTQRTSGYDLQRYGGGKLRARPDASPSSSFTFTSPVAGVPVTFAPFTAPIGASGSAIAKCVLYQVEDMTDKPVISDVDLTVEVQTPQAGACVATPTTTLFTRSDTSFDTKKMVAVTSADQALVGNCLRVTADPSQVAAPASTYIVACRTDPCLDDQNCDACVPASTAPCGRCGTKTCDVGGDFGTCDNQGTCAPGEVQACGPCGTGTQTCTAGCAWGACSGAGPCVP